MNSVLEATGLSKRYGRTWALRDCSLALPSGRVAALVGPNGAGKTTFLHLALGLLRPTTGGMRVFGHQPYGQLAEVLPRVGFVAQDCPLYRGFTVRETLTLGRKLNLRWDDALAQGYIERLGIPFNRPVGKLSGGQRAQVALVLALAKRPDLLLLDEPLASLDPLARRSFLSLLMEEVSETGLTVLFSSHIIGELERVCDFLVILSASHVQLMGDIQEIVQSHKRLVGPRQDEAAVASIHTLIEASHTERQTTLLVRANGPLFSSSWQVQNVSLEDVVLAYLGRQEMANNLPSPSVKDQPEIEVLK